MGRVIVWYGYEIVKKADNSTKLVVSASAIFRFFILANFVRKEVVTNVGEISVRMFAEIRVRLANEMSA